MLLRRAFDAPGYLPVSTDNPSFRSTQLPDLYTVIIYKYHKEGIAARWIRSTLKI